MAHHIDINEARIYVGTYAKYNDGSIAGGWLDLSNYSNKDEFYQACRQLHADEEDPEFMFQDYENIPEGLASECGLSHKFFEVRDAIIELGETQAEAFLVWAENDSHDLSGEDIDGLITSFDDAYQGEFDNEEDYAYHYVESCCELPEFALSYFDYEKFARDLFASDYWFDGGFVFRNN